MSLLWIITWVKKRFIMSFVVAAYLGRDKEQEVLFSSTLTAKVWLSSEQAILQWTEVSYLLFSSLFSITKNSFLHLSLKFKVSPIKVWYTNYHAMLLFFIYGLKKGHQILLERGFAIRHRSFSGKRVFGELLKTDTINYTWGILLKVTYWLKKLRKVSNTLESKSLKLKLQLKSRTYLYATKTIPQNKLNNWSWPILEFYLTWQQEMWQNLTQLHLFHYSKFNLPVDH